MKVRILPDLHTNPNSIMIQKCIITELTKYKAMKINTLGKQFGRATIKSGIEILGKSVSPVYTMASGTSSRIFVQEYFPEAKVILFDEEYRITTPEFWDEMDTEIYEITKKQWETNVYDCDDKAYTHKYWTLRIFEITQFTVYGTTHNLDGSLRGHHLWNARIASGRLFFFEPDGCHLKEIKKGEKMIINGREYRPISFEF